MPPTGVHPPGRGASREPSDVDLASQVRGGDQRALEELYRRYARPAYSLAKRIIGDPHHAEDVVQEVLFALWNDPTRYDPARGGFASWLLSAVHHKSVDAVRREEAYRRRRLQLMEAAVADVVAAGQSPSAEPRTGQNVDDEVWLRMRRERVRDALLMLPEPQREALALAYFGGFTQREVAEMVDVPLGTVKTRTLAGMRKLRDLLGVAGRPAPALTDDTDPRGHIDGGFDEGGTR